MKKRAYFLIAALSAILMWHGAAQAGSMTFSQWLKKISGKLGAHSASVNGKDSSVAGVKGAEEKKDEALYWKEPANAEREKKAFTEALSYAEKGDNAQARAGFEKFVKDYPDSPLAKDAREAIAMLDTARSEAK